MWELDHKEDWALKNWCIQTVLLEKTLESPLDYKEIRLVNPEENKPWIFIGSTDAKAEAPILWPLIRRANSLEKTLMLGNIEGKRRGRQRIIWLYGITDSMDMNLRANFRRQWSTRKPGMLQSMGGRVGHNLATDYQPLSTRTACRSRWSVWESGWTSVSHYHFANEQR